MKKLSAILILILCIVGAAYAQHESNLPAVITGSAQHEKAGWAKVAFQHDIHSDDQASISVVNTKTSAVVFAYDVNKKNTWHGDQTTAEACAKHLQGHIDGKE